MAARAPAPETRAEADEDTGDNRERDRHGGGTEGRGPHEVEHHAADQETDDEQRTPGGLSGARPNKPSEDAADACDLTVEEEQDRGADTDERAAAERGPRGEVCGTPRGLVEARGAEPIAAAA